MGRKLSRSTPPSTYWVLAEILAYLGLPVEPPRPAPSRMPSWLPDDAT